MKTAHPHWKKQILLFLISQCITLFGTQIVQMAIVWFVTLETGSGAWVAAFSLCAYLPQFFLSFPGGVWADRCSKKALIIGADTLIAAVTLAMLLMMPHITQTPLLLAALLGMCILRSAGAGIQTPAVNALIPQLVPQDQLMRYNGANAAMQSAVQFAAPAVAAAVLTTGTLRTTLAIDVITAILGIGLLLFLPLPCSPKAADKPAVFSDIAAGMRYALAHAVLRHVLAVYALFMFLSVPAGYLSGLLVSRMFGDTYWYLTAVEVVGFGGMMLGGLLMTTWGGFKQRRLTLAAGLALFGAMAAAMGISQRFIPYLCFMAVYGVGLTTVQTAVTTLLQEHADAAMQGRVFGLMGALYASCYPLGMALFGPMADHVSLQLIMVLSGVVLMGIAAVVVCPMRTARNTPTPTH